MADYISGSNAQFLMQIETQAGVKPTTKKALFKTTTQAGESIGQTVEELVSSAITSQLGVQDVALGQRTVAGSYTDECAPNSYALELNLLAALGQYTQTKNADGKFVKVFTRNKTLPTFFLQKGLTDAGIYFDLTGLTCESFALSATAQGALVTTTLGWQGARREVVNTAFDSNPLIDNSTIVSGIDTNVLESDAASCYSDISLNITTALEPGRCLGKDYATVIAAGRREITGSTTARLTNADYIKFWDEGREKEISVLIEKNGNSVNFFLPRIRYTGGESQIPTISSEGMMNVTIPFRALASKTLKTDIVVTVTNDNDLDSFLGKTTPVVTPTE